MKKIFLVTFAGIFALALCTQAQAQTSGQGDGYKNAIGLSVDFGTGRTGAGIGFKHFFTPHDAAEVNLLFYEGVTGLGAYYEYHGFIQNAAGLKWYLGLGPQFLFGNNSTEFAARIPIGLDYKIPNVPLNFAFDWRPLLEFSNGSHFTAARFGFGVRFAF